MSQISRDTPALRGLLEEGARTFGAINSRSAALTQLIADAGTAAAAFGDEADGVRQALESAPGALRQATTTFDDLRGTLDVVSPLVQTAKPATRRLDLFLSRLQPVLREGRPVLPRLAAIARQPGGANDLVDLLSELPRLDRTARRALPRAIQAMNRSQSNVDLLRAYTPDVVAAFGNLGQAASYYDANGHYIRSMPVLSALRYDADDNQLTAKPNFERITDFERAVGRCPGAALPPRSDGSAPVPVSGCRPESAQARP